MPPRRALLALLALLGAAPAASAQEPPWRAPAIHSEPPRPLSLGRVRAPLAPLAVHALSPALSAEELARTVRVLERVYATLSRRYSLEAPSPDGARGGGPELDVYLRSGTEGEAYAVVPDVLEYGNLWDRSAVYLELRAGMPEPELERSAAYALAEASLWAADARAVPAWRRALAVTLAEDALGLAPEADAVVPWQRDPSAAPFAARTLAEGRGAALFLRHLARRFDDEPRSLLRGMAAMPVGRTPAGAPHWGIWPDAMDVLELLTAHEPGGLQRVLLDFTVARGLVGGAGDPLLGWLPERSDVRPTPLATVRYEALPAHLRPARPLDKLGAAYVRIDTARAGTGGLDLWFHGVPWRRWAVTALRLDASGRDIGAATSPPVDHGEWSVAMESLETSVAVLVVVLDLGDGVPTLAAAEERGGLFALTVARH